MDITSPSVRSIRPNPSIEPTVQAVSLETAVMWNVPACSCWVMYGRRPRCKRNLTISEAFGCGHVFGL